jgi:hypothetical protein
VRRLVAVLTVTLAVATTGCAGGGAATTGATVPVESTTTTVPVEQQVEAAFLRSREIYAAAVRTFDTSSLATVFAEPLLGVKLREIGRLQAANTPGHISEDAQSVTVRLLASDHAEVDYVYVNHSVLVDGATGEPIEPDPDELLEQLHVLRLLEGQWKVTELYRDD